MSAILSENVTAIDGDMSVEQAVVLVSAYAATFDAILNVGENPHHYSHHDVLNAALLVLLQAEAVNKALHHAADAAIALIVASYDDDDSVKDAVVDALLDQVGVELTFAFARRAARMNGGAI